MPCDNDTPAILHGISVFIAFEKERIGKEWDGGWVHLFLGTLWAALQQDPARGDTTTLLSLFALSLNGLISIAYLSKNDCRP